MVEHVDLALFLLVCICFLTWTLDRYLARRVSPKVVDIHQPDPCKIKHTWIPIDAQPLCGVTISYAQTIVLNRCSGCGRHCAVAFAGTWELQDFLKTESEISQLERMVQ